MIITTRFHLLVPQVFLFVKSKHSVPLKVGMEVSRLVYWFLKGGDAVGEWEKELA